MRPFFVTAQEARKLPRLALLLLCVLYAVPGFISRDPWRSDDAASFGTALSMLRSPDSWLLPQVFGAPVVDEGPLYFWLSALAMRSLPFLDAHFAMRISAASILGALLICIWYASYALARRPEVQPSDPFGLSATRTDFGRTIADLAVVAMISCLGIIIRIHETTSELLQVALICLFLLGAARGLVNTRQGGVIAGIAIGASFLTKGLVVGFALLAALLLLPVLIRQYRLVKQSFLPIAVLIALVIGLSWPIALLVSNPARFWLWTAEAVPVWRDPKEFLVGLRYFLRTFTWYLWPLWPIAVWTIYRWRSDITKPAVALPLTTLAALLIGMIATGQSSEGYLMFLAPPLALLAAIGVPTVARSITNLIDWFAVMIFTSFGIAAWVYYMSLFTGYPERMARSATRYAVGYALELSPIAIACAAIASAAWLTVVIWRVSSRAKPLWRTIVISSSGLALSWFLLMTLWLPIFNHRKTYRDLTQEIAVYLPLKHRCVESRGLQLSQRASLGYFLSMRFSEQQVQGTQCDWFLIADANNARLPSADESLWTLRWEGRRPADKLERFRLYERRQEGSLLADAIR